MAAQGMFGASMKQNGGALLRIGEALQGLVGSLMRSLEEFEDVGKTLELEIAAEIGNDNPDESQANEIKEARPQLLLDVAGALKEMVRTFVSDINCNAEVQKLLPAIQQAVGGKNKCTLDDILQDLMISEQPPDDVASCSRTVMPVCISNKDLRLAKRVAGKSRRICKHWCEDHPEVVDPGVWRNLPHELVELVLAKLPLPEIIELYQRSKIWSVPANVSNLSIFRAACAEGHPKLFGLLGGDPEFQSPCICVHDMESEDWVHFDMADFPGSGFNWCHEFIYGCDGGLACFVPLEYFSCTPILVCNPLTDIWKVLPLLEDFEDRDVFLVQLRIESDQDCYSVTVVSESRFGTVFLAHVYNSDAGVWRSIDSGLVYGLNYNWKFGSGTPLLFDCSSKQVFDLRRCASLGGLNTISAYSVAKDRLFVLHESEEPGQRGYPMYLVSEYTWESNICDLRVLNVYETPIRIWQYPYRTMLFASPGSILVFVDNCEEWDEDHHQLIGQYNMSTKRWEIPPPLQSILYEQLQGSFLCELRWNVNP